MSYAHCWFNQSVCLFRGLNGSITLRPNPVLVPNNIRSSYRSRDIVLRAFHRQKSLHLLYPVLALAIYLERTRDLRATSQLLVVTVALMEVKRCQSNACHIGCARALPGVTPWPDRFPPQALRAHSTRGVAVSSALLRGVPVEDILRCG